MMPVFRDSSTRYDSVFDQVMSAIGSIPDTVTIKTAEFDHGAQAAIAAYTHKARFAWRVSHNEPAHVASEIKDWIADNAFPST